MTLNSKIKTALLLSSAFILVACSNDTPQEENAEEVSVESVESESERPDEAIEEEVVSENELTDIEAESSEEDGSDASDLNEELKPSNEATEKENVASTDEASDTEGTDEGATNEESANNPYGLNKEQQAQLDEIIKNNPGKDLKLENIAENIKLQETSTEQIVFPGTPYADQVDVVIEQDRIYQNPNQFAPYQVVENYETLPYGTEIRMRKTFQPVEGSNKYRGIVYAQFTDGSAKDFEVQIIIDSDERAPDTVHQNDGDDALTQRYPLAKEIERKYRSAREGVDTDLYLRQLREIPQAEVNEKEAVENFAFNQGIDVDQVSEYSVGERRGGLYAVKILTQDGKTYEGYVDRLFGQVVTNY